MARRMLIPTLAAVVMLLSGCTVVSASAAPGDGAGGGAGGSGLTTGRGVVPDDTAATTPSAAAAAARRALRTTDTIQLDAEQLMLMHSGDLVRTASMRDAPNTVALLTRLLGRPRTTQTAVGDGGHCVPASTSYTWGGALRVVDLARTSAAGNDYDVRVLAATVRARSGADVRLQGPDGIHVGQDIAGRIAATPDTDRESYVSDGVANWQVVLDRGWTGPRAGSATPTAPSTPTGSPPGDTAGPSPSTDAAVNGVSAITTGTVVAVLGSPMPVHSADDC